MKDDENINSQPFMHWRDRFLFVHGRRQQGQRRHRRGQGQLPQRHRRHDGRDVRAREFAKELGSVIIMIDLVIGYTAIQSMASGAARTT
jgi:ribulose-bisphosphate carboxylase large chain